MRKLKLDVEMLAVESFAVDPEEARGQGSVKGHSNSPPFTVLEPTICEDASCKWTQCNNLSCFAQCGGGGDQTHGGATCVVGCNTNPDIE